MGTRIGTYEVEAALGAGGMSQVWLARGAEGLVVLKRQLNPQDDQRLRDEWSVGIGLRHVGVVQTLELIEHEGRPLLVLEYVAGASLAALRKLGPLHAAAVCRIGADVAAALHALHEAVDANGDPLRILHRDVSPANIIIDRDGRARLIDLGIASFAEATAERTRTGDLRGTIRYLAPELFDAKAHTPRTDLWALGVCLFESILGRPAVFGPEAAMMAAILRGTLLDLRGSESLPTPFKDVLGRLCGAEDARYDQAIEAARELSTASMMLGDGRALAGAAVRGAANAAGVSSSDGLASASASAATPGRAGPASAGDDDAFVKFAASTYCGGDDDDLFGDMQVATQATPSAVTAIPRRPDPLTEVLERKSAFGPAPVTVVMLKVPHTPSSPGSQPASEESWAIPQPITGPGVPADGAGATRGPTAQLERESAPTVEVEAPLAPTLEIPLPSLGPSPMTDAERAFRAGAPRSSAGFDAPIVDPLVDDAAVNDLLRDAGVSKAPLVIAAFVVIAVVVAIVLLRSHV